MERYRGHKFPGRWSLGSVILTMLLLFVLAIPVGPSEAQSNSTNLSLAIQGEPTMYTTQTLDLCGLVHSGSCPVSFAVDENFKQSVSITFVTSSSVLHLGDTIVVTASPNPATPSAVLDFVFSYNGHSYTYPYQVSAFPTIGSSTLLTVPIPVGALTAALGLPPLPITLNFNSIVTSDLAGTLSGNGFAGSQSLSWSSVSSEQASLAFSGGVDTALLNLGSFVALQNWGIALSAGISGVVSVPLFNTTVTNLEIQSTDPQVYTWYHVSIAESSGGSVSPATGDGWYMAGYQLQLRAIPNSGFDFGGWLVNGQMTSTSQSYSYAVQSPTALQAQFTTLTTTSGSSPPPSNTQGIGLSVGELLIPASVVVAAVIIALAIRRRH